METPLPNDSFQASFNPPVGGRLRSFRRDWFTNKCTDNVLNIITNGYVLPFISRPILVRAPLIQSGYKALQKELALTSCIQSLLSKNIIERVENVKSLWFYKLLPQVAGVPVHFPSLRTSHGPSGLYNDCKRGEADGPVKGNQTSPVSGRLADQDPVSGRSKSEHTDSGEKSELKPTQLFSFVGYEYHLDSALVKPTQERWLKLQDLILRIKSKHVLTARCLMSLIACLNGENGPGGTPSHEALSVSPQGALEISSVVGHPPSLDRNHFSTPPRMVAKSHKRDERLRPSSQRPQYPTLYRRLKRRLGCSLRANLCKSSVVRQGKKATHKCFKAEGGFSGPSKVQGPVSKPNSVSCHRQFNSGSLHKQTKRNPLSRDVRSPVKDHDLVPSLSDYSKSQTHSRVSECDGRPTVQLKPSSVNRMVTASAGVQTDLPQVVHSSCRSVCHSPEPQSSTVRVSSPRPKCFGHRCSEHILVGLTAYAYPPTALLHRVIQKVRKSNYLIIIIAPVWPGVPWFWDLVQLSTEIPLQLPVSTTFLKQSHNYVFHSNPQHLNLHAWCLEVDNSKNKASLWRWQRHVLPLRGHQQEPSINQNGPYLKNGAEKIRWISPLPLRNKS